MEWNPENCLKLIALYKAKPEIWQYAHRLYRNRINRQEAWIEIANGMESTVDKVKSKIKVLLAAFRREKLKEGKWMGSAKGRNEAFKSNWFAYDAFQFIMDKDRIQETSVEKKVDLESTEIENNVKITGGHLKQEFKVEGNFKTTVKVGISSGIPPKKRKIEVELKPKPEKVFSRLHNYTNRRDEEYAKFLALKRERYIHRTESIVHKLVDGILFDADSVLYERQEHGNTMYSNLMRTYTPPQLVPCTLAPLPVASSLVPLYLPSIGYPNNRGGCTQNTILLLNGDATSIIVVPSNYQVIIAFELVNP